MADRSADWVAQAERTLDWDATHLPVPAGVVVYTAAEGEATAASSLPTDDVRRRGGRHGPTPGTSPAVPGLRPWTTSNGR